MLFEINLSKPDIPTPPLKTSAGKYNTSNLGGFKIIDTRKYNKSLLNLLDSPTHNSCINQKIDYITSNHKFLGINDGEAFSISKTYDSTDLLNFIAKDFEIFNGFAFQVILNKSKQVSSIEPIEFKNLFFDTEGGVYYDEFNLQKVDLFDPKKGGVFVYKPCKIEETPRPLYFSAVNSILTEIGINKFHLTNVSSGFSAGALVNLIDETESDDTKRQKRANKIRERVGGEENGGGIIVNFADTKEGFADIKQFAPVGIDKVFETTSIQVQNAILSAHGVAGELVGIQKQGSLFDQSSIKESYNLFSNNYIKNRCRIIEQSINFVFGFYDNTKTKKIVLEPKVLFESEGIIENDFLRKLTQLTPDIRSRILDTFTTAELKDLLK